MPGKFRSVENYLHLSYLHLIVVFGISIGIYTLTLPRSITLEDAGLFQLVCHLGGISHPPGYPLFTLLCQPFVHLPIFEKTVFAGNFLNAIFASSSVTLLHHICYRLAGRNFAWIASLAYAFSATFWSQAIILEVYTLSVLMFLICLTLTFKFIETENLTYWYGLGFCFGLAMCNHWPLMLLSSPALLILLTYRSATLTIALKSPRFWAFSLLSLCLGLTPYLSLITDQAPAIGVFGAIDSPEQFAKYIARSAYSDNFDHADIFDKLKFAAWLPIESLTQMGSWAAPLILLGIYLSFRKLPLTIGFAILSLYLGSTYFLLLLLNFDFDPFYQSIFKPYPIIAYLAVCVWFSLGVEALISRLTDLTIDARLVKAMPLIAITLIFVSNYASNNRSEDNFVANYARTILNSLPLNSVLFTYGDFETGPIGYLNRVEGVRPDVEIREWENLVFDNRLASPFSPEEARDEASRQFIEGTERPVVSISNRLRPSTNYGGYFQHSPGPPQAINPKLDAYMQHLVYLSNNQLIADPHEQTLLIGLLINYAKMYLAHAKQSPDHRARISNQIGSLQSTFAGKLITLEFALQRTELDEETLIALISMGRSAEQNIPEMISSKNLAAFYNYFGHIIARHNPSSSTLKSGVTEAMEYLGRSISAYPAKENPSICQLNAMSKTQGIKTPNVLARLDLTSCE